MDMGKALDTVRKKTLAAWERGMEGAKESEEKERKWIIYEIMFYERKGGGNKVGKHLEELPEPEALPKIDAKHRESKVTLEK